jgi:hypothetical protein
MSEGAEVATKRNVNSEVRYRLDLEGVQNVAEVAAKRNVNSEVKCRLDLVGVQNVGRSRSGSGGE